jgi:hypothetical protein
MKVLLVAMSVPGCVEIKAVTGPGNIVEEEREVSGFSSVDLPPWDEGDEGDEGER